MAHARAFLSELARVMPAGYRTVIDGEILWLISPDGGMAGSSSYWLTSDVLTEEEALIGAVQSLHQIQQEIAEETTEPWPARAGADYPGFPEPHGELIGDDLLLWFGNRDAPVLALHLMSLGGVLIREQRTRSRAGRPILSALGLGRAVNSFPWYCVAAVR